jgi:hypothetical protein
MRDSFGFASLARFARRRVESPDCIRGNFRCIRGDFRYAVTQVRVA